MEFFFKKNIFVALEKLESHFVVSEIIFHRIPHLKRFDEL